MTDAISIAAKPAISHFQYRTLALHRGNLSLDVATIHYCFFIASHISVNAARCNGGAAQARKLRCRFRHEKSGGGALCSVTERKKDN